MKHILVVGAGFAGAVYARELAVAGHDVHVIDRRDHIAGNAFDYVSPQGIRVHRYGPHLFHTSNASVVDWLKPFSRFVPYEHRVQALLTDGRLVPLPINRATLNTLFGQSLTTEAEVQTFLQSLAEPIAEPRNAAEYLRASIGQTITDLFFRPYTKKMWQLDLEEMDAAVVKRIPIRFDDDDRYFPNDAFQMMPEHGYTKLFENILDHENIRVTLNQPFGHDRLDAYAHCFNSMPIDEFFGYRHGRLPYRSIRFHHKIVSRDTELGTATTINYTDAGPFTRVTDWTRIPGHFVHETGEKILTEEEPCDYRDNDDERYYPVKSSDGRHKAVLAAYQADATLLSNVTFIGRCGTYQYLDMHQVINQSLAHVREWLQKHVR